MRYFKSSVWLVPLAASAALGFWGLDWCLPDRDRVARVLSVDLDTPQFHRLLESNWKALYAKLGSDILLHPEVFSYGFHDEARVDAGWVFPPDILINPARSAYLRSGHEDEPDILVAVARLRPQRLELNPRIYFYGGAYMYLLAAWIGSGAVATGTRLTSSIAYYLANPEHMAWIYYLGRSFSVAVYMLMCVGLFFLGKRYWGAKAGLWASLFLAVSPGITVQAHYMKPHLLGVLFVMGLFYFCAELLRRNDRRLWLGAGCMLGLAAGSAIYLWTAGMFLVFVVVLRFQTRGRSEISNWGGPAITLGGAFATFLATNPFLVYEFRTSWEALRRVAGFSSRDPMNVVRFLATGLPAALTWPGLLWVLLGIVNPRAWRDPVSLLAGAGFIYHLMMAWIFQSADQVDSIRQFPATFAGFLLAGRLVSDFASKPATSLGRRVAGVLAGFLAAASIAYAGLWSGVFDYNCYLDARDRSTRHDAGDWIARNLPAGSQLGFLRLPQPSNAPYFDWKRYALWFIQPGNETAWSEGGSLPRYLVLTHAGYNDRDLLGPVLERRYRLLRVFRPYFVAWIGPAPGELRANPWVEIFELRH